MKFRYVNQPPNEYDYHVARADARDSDDHIRIVAYGLTRPEAETALLDNLDPDLKLIYLGSC